MWSTLAFCAAQLAVVGLSVPFGIGRMVQAYVALNLLWMAVWFTLSHKEIGLRAIEALRDVAPYVVLSIVSVAIGYLAAQPFANLYVSFLIKVVVVAAVYCLSLWLLRSTIFTEVLLFITKKEIR